MSDFASLWQVRNLMTQALGILNDLDDNGSSDLCLDLRGIRQPLHTALRSIDQAAVDTPFWPGLAARA
jgi:hypothetical protein